MRVVVFDRSAVFRYSVASMAFASLLFAAATVRANPLTDPTASANVTFSAGATGSPPVIADSSNINPAVTGCAAAGGGGNASPCGLSINTSNPYTVATAQTASPSGYASFMASSLLTYYVQIDGPAISNVPLLINGNLTTAVVAAPNATAAGTVAELLVYDVTQNIELETAQAEACTVSGECGPYSSDVTVNTSAMVNSGDILRVELDSALTLTGASSALTIVDPYFEIDPSFASANEFTIATSPGIANVVPTSVPEPSTLLLLAAGVFGVAALQKRFSA